MSMRKLFGVLLMAALPLTMVPTVAAHAQPAAGLKAKVKITSFMFSPTPLNIKVGTKVIWINKASIAHTTTSDDGTSWDSGSLMPGAKFKRNFNTAGTFTYHCSIHPFMTASVVVSP
jgi:plastocyanin